MKRSIATHRGPAIFLKALGMAALVGACMCRRAIAQGSTDPRNAMIAALAAPGPHPSLGAEAKVFDRFVGAWECDYSFHLPDGTVTHASGELFFGWVLNGRVLQDIWTSFPKDPSKERVSGTSLRYYDSAAKTWHVFFVNPAFGSTMVHGGVEGDRIVLRGTDGDGSMLRWSFNDIRDNDFVWRGERSRDNGKSWVLEEEHHMRRRTSPGR